MKTARVSLIERFLNIVRDNPDHTAVVEEGRAYSYLEFYSLVCHLLTEIKKYSPSTAIGLHSGRTVLSYAGMWAAILLGLPYVPLNPSLPSKRLKQIISQSNLDIIICYNSDANRVVDLIPEKQIYCCSIEDALDKKTLFELSVPNPLIDQNMVYILFTSGSTGSPKGVPISYSNLLAFIDNVNKILDYHPTDRVAQVCETSFDFSVHEIYLALLSGASLFPARNIDLFNPTQYIQKNEITIWHSVPSLANVAFANKQLKDGCLGSLRVTVFNGEPLTKTLAELWRRAASNSQVWNYYGPTECTVAVSCQKVAKNDGSICKANNISIGHVFEGIFVAILCNGEVINSSEFYEGIEGELLIGGPQTFDGYLGEVIDSPFISDAGHKKYYRTGDLVYWQNEKFFILGRLDHQVKIGGHRIELMEIEHQLKEFFNTELLIVLAIPEKNPKALVVCSEVDIDLSTLKQSDVSLPNYMIPGKAILVEKLPKNQNGKVDRQSLMQIVGAC